VKSWTGAKAEKQQGGERKIGTSREKRGPIQYRGPVGTDKRDIKCGTRRSEWLGRHKKSPPVHKR